MRATEIRAHTFFNSAALLLLWSVIRVSAVVVEFWLERMLIVDAAELVWNESILVCTLWDTCGWFSSPSGFLRLVIASIFFSATALCLFPLGARLVEEDEDDDAPLLDPLLARTGILLDEEAAEAVGFTARRRFVDVTTLMALVDAAAASGFFTTAACAPGFPPSVAGAFLLPMMLLLLMSCSAPRLRLRVSRAASSSESALAMLTPPAAGATPVPVVDVDATARPARVGCTFSILKTWSSSAEGRRRCWCWRSAAPSQFAVFSFAIQSGLFGAARIQYWLSLLPGGITRPANGLWILKSGGATCCHNRLVFQI